MYRNSGACRPDRDETLFCSCSLFSVSPLPRRIPPSSPKKVSWQGSPQDAPKHNGCIRDQSRVDASLRRSKDTVSSMGGISGVDYHDPGACYTVSPGAIASNLACATREEKMRMICRLVSSATTPSTTRQAPARPSLLGRASFPHRLRSPRRQGSILTTLDPGWHSSVRAREPPSSASGSAPSGRVALNKQAPCRTTRPTSAAEEYRGLELKTTLSGGYVLCPSRFPVPSVPCEAHMRGKYRPIRPPLDSGSRAAL